MDTTTPTTTETTQTSSTSQPNKTGIQRDEKLQTLAAGYTTTKRKIEIIILTLFTICWFEGARNLFRALSLESLYITFVAIITSMFVADFLGGVVHWACDTWGSPSSKYFGVFIRSFREHHIDPKAMTKHDFVEVSADSCIIPLPFLIAVTFWRVENAYLIELFILHCTIWTTFFVMMTNQIHKWAHISSYNRPSIVAFLQKTGIILNSQVHNVHHRAPFDTNYCIFNGWMNPILASFGFWRRVESVITSITGVIPRADDADWSGRFEVDANGVCKTKSIKDSL